MNNYVCTVQWCCLHASWTSTERLWILQITVAGPVGDGPDLDPSFKKISAPLGQNVCIPPLWSIPASN